MDSLKRELDEKADKRAADAVKFEALDEDACMICWAHGEDKQSIWLSCFYEVSEIVPEALDMGDRGFYLRVCKTCRGLILGAIGDAVDRRRITRGCPKGSDGDLEVFDPDRNIPMRVNGATVMVTMAEYEQMKAKRRR